MMSTVYSQAVSAHPRVEAVIAAAAEVGEVAVLDSSDCGPGRGRWTIIGVQPAAVACWQAGKGDPFEGMRERLARTALDGGRPEPFPGGWIGYFGYEAGRYVEPPKTPPDRGRRDLQLPVARFALFDTAAIYDNVAKEWRAVAVDLPAGAAVGPREPAAERAAAMEKLLQEAESVEPASTPPVRCADEPLLNMTRAEYLRLVRRAKEYIAAGDIFQVNVTRRMSFPVREAAVQTYLRLRRVNPAAYSAFITFRETGAGQCGDCAILSASPELFLQLRGREVVTRPIKGTRPRSEDPVLDAVWRAELAASAKDRAELAMIVDLERNDLGRVCEYGSIEVVAGGLPSAHPAGRMPAPLEMPAPPDTGKMPVLPTARMAVPHVEVAPFDLEAHPTVHHLVGTVRGQLRPECDGIDLLRATFPGGSITGAPKVRAMEIIEELEPTERSVYTGAIGYFGLDGAMTFNIAIRTLILADGRCHLQVGGGIVADSIPEDEYQETEDKARGLLRALRGEHSAETRLPELAGKP